MKIAIIGYGKMGHAIEKIALGRGHEIVCTVDAGEEAKFASDAFKGADVAIEFTTPTTAVENFRRVIGAGIPLVAGTTGWTARMDEVKQLLEDAPQGMFWTSNFSIGVSLFQAIARRAEELIAPYRQYTPEMTEVHHIHKLDHPSGTAVSTAGQLIAASDGTLKGWTEDEAVAAADPSELLIRHRREGEVPGTHTITWTSPVDVITVEHRAFSREGFALGAVIAAEWMVENHPRGLQGMQSLLGI